MREAQFLKQNKDRWQQYERVPTKDPDELADRFVQLTDDLAYAKTFYSKSKTVQYLNSLASRFHLAIYKNRKEKKNRFASFFVIELPLTLARYRKDLLYAFLFFSVFFLIGWISAKHDDNFVRLILGDGYVNMTNENIEKGDPFGVYKSEDPVTMFVAIAQNNIKVSFWVFVLGIFACVFTVYLLFTNGIMLGSFMYYFFSKGLGAKSVMVIFIHGTIEIIAIVFAGAAGLIIGKSWLFPGTYTRLEGLVRGGKDSLKIILGLIPFFILAAFFEGFVTRHTEMPVFLSATILGGSLFLMIWYFVIYPWRLQKRLALPVKDADPSMID
ncbi:MAG: stage II sporulation protein M [Gemmatimonadaceae bacterium]|nr:stage II sporulation protein M [Chitinophagaceae bacterium]